MYRKFYQYQKIQEGTDDQNSFEIMMRAPSKLFFDDVRDQLLRYVDRIVAESKYQSLINPSSYFAVFEYKEKLFKMRFTSRGMSVYCEYVSTPPTTDYNSYQDDGGYIDVGSMSQSITIMFKKIDKFLKKNV